MELNRAPSSSEVEQLLIYFSRIAAGGKKEINEDVSTLSMIFKGFFVVVKFMPPIYFLFFLSEENREMGDCDKDVTAIV